MMIGTNATAALILATLGLALLGQPETATADDVAVIKNGTPLVQAPVRNAPTEWKLSRGFPLTVMEERGDWLKVKSSQLPDEGGELWVRANQVATLGGEQGGAGGSAGAAEEPTGYRVELTGSAGMKFKLECRSVQDGRISFRPHYNVLPQSYEYSTSAINCFAWKKEHRGDLQVALVAIYPTKERVIGRAGTQGDPASIFARSSGPWGPAAVVTAYHDDLLLPARAP